MEDESLASDSESFHEQQVDLDDSGNGIDEDGDYEEDILESGDDEGEEQEQEEYSEKLEDEEQQSAAGSTSAPRQGIMHTGSTASASTTATEAEAPALDVKANELNKKYFKLLNAGRLASRKKADVQSDEAALRSTMSRRSIALMELSQSRTVHEPDLAKLTTTCASMDVAPVHRASRPPSEISMRISLCSEKSRSSHTLGPTGQFRVAQLASSAPTTPSARKILSPGPGAYDTSAADTQPSYQYSFGTSRQRPANFCVADTAASPGPMYNPQKEFVSTMSNPSRTAFSRTDVGSRFSLVPSMPSNAPQWNPGPGDYDARTLPDGRRLESGADAPKAVFGKSQKLLSPERSLAASVFISEEHAKKENMAVHSPGPQAYSPNIDVTRHKSGSYTFSTKTASYFDAVAKQTSPGPIYAVPTLDHRGTKVWGDKPKATFGRSNKKFEPERNLSATAFISKDHAQHSNLAVHSPGPIYLPESPKQHPRAPHLSSGPADRFYDRFEPGRLG